MRLFTFDCPPISLNQLIPTLGLTGEYLGGAPFPQLNVAQRQMCHNFQCDLEDSELLSCNLHPYEELVKEIPRPTAKFSNNLIFLLKYNHFFNASFFITNVKVQFEFFRYI